MWFFTIIIVWRIFQENDIYLPIVVLEELDKFKKGNEQINFNAREFVRELDLITDDNLFTKGAPLGEGLGRLFVVAGMVDSPRVRDSFPERIPDHQILSVVDWLSTKKPKMKTILVTKDVKSAHEGAFHRSAVRRLHQW